MQASAACNFMGNVDASNARRQISGPHVMLLRKRGSSPLPTARIRNGVLTLPLSEEIQEKLDVRDGDELEVHVFKGSVSFTPKSAEARERA